MTGILAGGMSAHCGDSFLGKGQRARGNGHSRAALLGDSFIDMKLKPVSSKSKLRLDARDARVPSRIKGDDLEKKRAEQSAELGRLQRVFYADARHSMLIVLQGRDASGKDGTIRSVFGATNPQGCEVDSFGVPTELERSHDYLWRIHAQIPALGMIGIFNRSHYEDVLVVRVHDLVPKETWKQRYAHISAFEELLAAEGTIVLKYFLHISRKEQKERLLERERKAETAWKLNADDWRERDCWDDYTEAYEDAISKTAAKHAPWIVVPADAKWYRNLLVAESIVETLRQYRKPWRRKLEEMGRKGRAALADYRAERKTSKRRPAEK
jgi:PPK2 family polyphosphate:nucleotide phosphotransferase